MTYILTTPIASINLAGIDRLTNILNSIGSKLYDACIKGGYWFFAVITFTDIIKKGKNHDYMGCLKVALAGAGGFAAIKITRIILDIILEV